MGDNFMNKYQNVVISKSVKRQNKIVKFEVKNFEHLRCKFEVEKLLSICVEILELIKNKTGMDQSQDCCKA